MIEGWVGDSSARHNRCDRGRTKSLTKLKEARGLGHKRRGMEWGQLQASEDGWRRGAI